MSAHPLDVRLAHLEGAYEQISDRLNGFDLRFARLEDKVDTGFDRLNERMDREFAGVRAEFAAVRSELRRDLGDVRRTMITGAASIAAFILASIIIPFFAHAH